MQIFLKKNVHVAENTVLCDQIIVSALAGIVFFARL